MGFWVFFGVRDAVATGGQYLALSKAWWSCLFWNCFGPVCTNSTTT